MAPKRRRLSFGSIDKRASGRFRARYRNPLDKSEWISAPYTFQTREQARQWLAETEAEILTGIWEHPRAIEAREEAAKKEAAAETVTLNEWVGRWLRQMRHDGVSANTMRSYTSNLKCLTRALGEQPIRSITPQQIEDWYNALAEPYEEVLVSGEVKTRQRSRRTCQNIAANVRSCFNYAVDQNVIDTSPLQLRGVSPKGQGRKKPLDTLPTPAEINAAIAAADPVVGACILIAANAGLRHGEIAALRRKDLHLVDNPPSITVSGGIQRDVDGSIVDGAGKSDNAIRTIPIPKPAAKWLRTYVTEHVPAGANSRVVYNPNNPAKALTDKALWEGKRRWKEARKAAGIPDTFKFHDLRKLYLTRMGQNGATLAELQQLAGHADVNTVMIYQQAEKSRLADLANKLGETLADADQTDEENVIRLTKAGNQKA